MQNYKTLWFLNTLILLTLLLCVVMWQQTRGLQARWTNVPPIPDRLSATGITLGDPQFAYRSYGIGLQSFGNTGGRFTPLKDYNYKNLGKWFFLQHFLDPQSNFTPMLAAYYFGASQDPQKLAPLIDYLEVAGNAAEGEKWRWLAHAVYLARFKMKDTERALGMAYKLAAIENPDMPIWARQMPANVLNQRGEKQAAAELILRILESSADKIHPNEVNALVHYLCIQTLPPKNAKQLPLCKESGYLP